MVSMLPLSPLQQNAYLLAAGVIASIYVICAVILTLGVREQRGEGSLGSGAGPGAAGLCPSAWASGFGRCLCSFLTVPSGPQNPMRLSRLSRCPFFGASDWS